MFGGNSDNVKTLCPLARLDDDTMGAAVQRIADWLEKLGMSEYAQRFAESDIDTSVLRDLTDQDLKELGVSLGHRRKMLRAIAELAGVVAASPQPTWPSRSPKTLRNAAKSQ
jgi:SAM domain (Sterile alpha motif)